MRWLALALVLAACGDRRPNERLELVPYLGSYLHSVAVLDRDARNDAIAAWKLDRAQWQRTVVPPYDALYDDYDREFHLVAVQLAASLAASPDAIEVHKHYADDPGRGEQVARWAFPVLAESFAATIGGTSAGVAFARVDGSWKVVEVARSANRRVEALDASCLGQMIDGSDRKPCRDIGWEVTDAALRNQRDRFAHACTLVRTACGKPTP